MHPHGIVTHSGRWYLIGTDPGIGEDRTFRLDRVADVRTEPGTFDAPDSPDPAQRLLSGLAATPYRHEVTLRINGAAEQIRTRLPAGVAGIDEPKAGDNWLRVELRAEHLDWLPPVLASLDLPFRIERPDELRDMVAAFAERLASSARRTASGEAK